MREFNLFEGYPEPKEPRTVGPHLRTILNRIAACYRDHEFYDGERVNGYGGMVDDGRWGPIAESVIKHYGGAGHKILQINAHKGFLLKELFNRGMRVTGVEVSQYACENGGNFAPKHIQGWTKLPFSDHSFDVVICASPVYSLNLPDSIKLLKEIERVKAKTGKSWITLAAYEDENDIEGLMLLRYWFLLGTTILTKGDWIEVMKHAGYTGDYRFDTAKYLNLIAEDGAEYKRIVQKTTWRLK